MTTSVRGSGVVKIEATGLIKHVSKLKKVPTGKLRVLSPGGLRGLEVHFHLADVQIPQDDRRYLESGMTLRFRIGGDSRNGFIADEIKPVDCAEYNGSVIKVPSSTDPTIKTTVSLDLTLTPVVVSKHSLRNLRPNQPLSRGDYVRVSIRWTDWMRAHRARVKPEFDIVQVLEATKLRPRALSQGRDVKDADHGRRVVRVSDVSSEELSPQHERLNRQREIAQRGQRQRSRSVGCLAALNGGIIPLPYHHHVPPHRYPNQYSMMSPDVMYGALANFYNHRPSWMPPKYMPPYAPRGAQ